jgi:P-type Cu2+ transporter
MRFATALLDIARQHRRAVRRVFALALAYNIATVIAGLMGHLSPLAAAVLMPLSSVATLSVVGWTFRGRRADKISPESAMVDAVACSRKATLSTSIFQEAPL